ncbi:hypothetical protein MPSEU_000974300 [Mayamaea pseudoterrestris]|nr:hypothetical protein MPSEU_000974300 [Mayamaea pseudoterrestris]
MSQTNSLLRLLQAAIDGNAAATGITFSSVDDDTVIGKSINDDQDDDSSISRAFYVLFFIASTFICVVVPIGCGYIHYCKRQQPVQPTTTDPLEQQRRQQAKADAAERLVKLTEQLRRSDLQTILTAQDLECHANDDEEMGRLAEFCSAESDESSPDNDANTQHVEPSNDRSITSTDMDVELAAAFQRVASEDKTSSNDYSTHCLVRLTPTRTASNVCAICLSDYQQGDAVVWSSNQNCRHAFHVDCMLDWLVKIPGGAAALCPCCRQVFVDIKS